MSRKDVAPVAVGIALALTLTAASALALGWRDPGRSTPCESARIDGDIYASGLGHNTFDERYRAPFGAVPADQGRVTLRLRTCHGDADRAWVRIWNSVESRESWVQMAPDRVLEADPSLGPVDYWKAEIQIPRDPTVLYYFFEIGDREARRYYIANPVAGFTGGWGRFHRDWNDRSSFQLTVFDSEFRTPDWLKGATIYQILPDRFRNGDRTNDPAHGSGFIFGKSVRFVHWNQELCDPRGNCPGEDDNQFYGGDLEGVTERLDTLSELGVKAIYFNPVFQSSTNHRYDTQDYYLIDPKLGTLGSFDRLLGEARARGMNVVLDGVFNHGSADSPYFDIFKRWPGVGACEAPESLYRDWFYFPHFANQPRDWARPDRYLFCAGPHGTLTTYESWWGYYEHPVYRKDSEIVRNLFFTDGERSVAPYWVKRGTAGWRLDVAGDVDPGQGSGSRLGFWRGFRKAVKAANPDAVMIGEEWSNATSWLLGREWDSATNYRWRSTLLNWLADGCQGIGCSGDAFEDDDNNWASHAGAIAPISERELDRRLRSIQEDYPPEAWQAMMNPLGSHDTQRVLFVLKKVSRDDSELAKRKLKFAAIFQFTYPGAPVIYYGDEVGVAAEGRFYNGRWKDDPYNRVVYPWADEGLRPDLELREHFKRLGQLRASREVLRKGAYETVVTDDAQRVFGFRRYDGANQIWTVLNRAGRPGRVEIAVRPQQITEGTVLTDLLNGGQFKVLGGRLDLGEIPGLWGRILVAEPSLLR